jgi:GR25 family glycosyltransferase involved in LPS biosynthesis
MEVQIMPVASKAYILKIDTPISKEYAEICAKSCDAVGLDWKFFQGFQGMSGREAWLKTGIKMKFTEARGKDPNTDGERAECCSAGHGAIWKAIAEGPDEAAIILEHDAIMLHSMNIDIPDGFLVALGYKLQDPSKYNHIKAGPPKELIEVNGHEGAHAYAITRNTARMLIEEIEDRGVLAAVDNAYFLPKERKTKMGLLIASPTPSIGWLRQSTIWKRAATRNAPFIKSFRDSLKS